MKFLTIAYALKIKSIFKEVEPKINAIILSTLNNKKIEKVINAVYPYAEKAFQEGIDFGNFLTSRKVEHQLIGRDKKIIFQKFINSLNTASKVFYLKVDNLTDKGTPKYDAFFKEYVTTMSKATNRLIIDAGARGIRKAVR